MSQYSTFRVGPHTLAIAVLDVQEVLRSPVLTEVPLAPECVAGLTNLRGQIVPAIDMWRLLQVGREESEEAVLSVVLRTSQGAVSLHVDEIGDVVEVDEGKLEQAPPNLSGSLSRLLRGIEARKEGLLMVLDTGKTLEAAGA